MHIILGGKDSVGSGLGLMREAAQAFARPPRKLKPPRAAAGMEPACEGDEGEVPLAPSAMETALRATVT